MILSNRNILNTLVMILVPTEVSIFENQEAGSETRNTGTPTNKVRLRLGLGLEVSWASGLVSRLFLVHASQRSLAF